MSDLGRLGKIHVPLGVFVSIISLPKLGVFCTDGELVDERSTENAKLIEGVFGFDLPLTTCRISVQMTEYASSSVPYRAAGMATAGDERKTVRNSRREL